MDCPHCQGRGYTRIRWRFSLWRFRPWFLVRWADRCAVCGGTGEVRA